MPLHAAMLQFILWDSIAAQDNEHQHIASERRGLAEEIGKGQVKRGMEWLEDWGRGGQGVKGFERRMY
jgi:hypothetical protein